MNEGDYVETDSGDSQEDPGPVQWRPPYVPYATLVGLLDTKLGANPLPPRIDRGFLDNYAGSVQAMLLATLRTIGLVGDEGRVLPPLIEATRTPALRKKILRSWAESFYAEQQALARQNATAQMLHESFAYQKLAGSTLRKAVVFYLSLVDDVGLEKSPHFKAPRQTASGTARPRKKSETTALPVAASELVHSAGELLKVDFGDAGSVRLEVDVKWLQLPIETFSRLRQVLSELEQLGRADSGEGEDSGDA